MLPATRTPIALILAGLLSVAAAYAAMLLGWWSPVSSAWALALGASLVLSGILALAAVRPGGTPRALRATVGLVFFATFGGLAYALAMPSPATDGPLLLGFPRTTAIMLLVTGLIPLIALPLAYARAFDRDVLGDGDVARIQAAIAKDAKDARDA
jgi:membrane associated rhomboid family serine protease